jgi:predicted Zn finger-like uncharacterized protein
MQVTCGNCQSKIRVPDSAAGKKGKCPKCGNVIAIPELDATTDEPAPEPGAKAAAGSPFDFGGEEPPAKKSSRRTDDAVEASTPSRKSKARAADDEEEVDAAEDADDDEDRPRKVQKTEESIGLSLTSLILGIVSLLTGCGGIICCCTPPISLLCGIGALVTGFLGMKKGGKVLAIIGMSLGGFSLLLAIGGIIYAFVGTGFTAFLQMVGAR